jgi:hypothetical protein
MVSPKREEAKRLFETGLCYAEIGRRLGISRERVRQFFKPRPKQNQEISQGFNPDELLTPGLVARLSGVHSSTIRRWSCQRILTGIRQFSNGHRRYRCSDVIDFMVKREKISQTEALNRYLTLKSA